MFGSSDPFVVRTLSDPTVLPLAAVALTVIDVTADSPIAGSAILAVCRMRPAPPAGAAKPAPPIAPANKTTISRRLRIRATVQSRVRDVGRRESRDAQLKATSPTA